MKSEALSVGNQLPDEVLEDLAEGLKIIEKRSIGLMSFVNNYRTLISLPAPQFNTLNCNELLAQVGMLMQNELTTRGIELTLKGRAGDMTIHADAGLIEQVLINLLRNACDALDCQADPQIEIDTYINDSQSIISVKDNGPGIDSDQINQIFVPFFTTKKNGNGIGLSLCRQIMALHKGSIEAISPPGKGACFLLRF